MLDELRDLFLRALESDGADIIPLMTEWNAAIAHVQEVFDRMTDKDSRLVERPRWIPVSERLPGKWTWVLVCFDGADVPSTGFVNSAGDWIGEDMYTNYDVTHWMPLPEPPKEEA